MSHESGSLGAETAGEQPIPYWDLDDSDRLGLDDEEIGRNEGLYLFKINFGRLLARLGQEMHGIDHCPRMLQGPIPYEDDDGGFEYLDLIASLLAAGEFAGFDPTELASDALERNRRLRERANEEARNLRGGDPEPGAA